MSDEVHGKSTNPSGAGQVFTKGYFRGTPLPPSEAPPPLQNSNDQGKNSTHRVQPSTYPPRRSTPSPLQSSNNRVRNSIILGKRFPAFSSPTVFRKIIHFFCQSLRHATACLYTNFQSHQTPIKPVCRRTGPPAVGQAIKPSNFSPYLLFFPCHRSFVPLIHPRHGVALHMLHHTQLPFAHYSLLTTHYFFHIPAMA